MPKLINIVVILLSLVLISRGNVLPVEKCSLEDETCLVSAFKKSVPIFTEGIPDVGVEVLDVMEMEHIEFDLSGLQFSLTDGRLEGLKNSVVESVKWDTAKQRIEVKFMTNCTITGHYTAGGRILILPITGDGQMTLSLTNLDVRIFMDYDTKSKEGKKHIALKKYEFEFEVKDGAQFDLTNLFNGNKELSGTMLTFLNENWKQISVEFGRPMMDSTAKKIVKNVAKFFEKVSIEDIANV